MIQLQNRLLRLGPIIVVLVIGGVISAPAALEKVSPFHTMADFSRSSTKPWSAFVLTPEGKRVYKFSFEPERDVSGVLIGVNLVLSRPGSSSNLLNPPRNWHGLQPYSFLANDLLHGPDKSTFGAQRMIKVENEGIVVKIEILNVDVRTAAKGEPQIDNLSLALTVDNISP